MEQENGRNQLICSDELPGRLAQVSRSVKMPGSSTAGIVQCDLEKISACAFNSAVVSGQHSFVPRAVIMNIPVRWLQEARSGGYQPQLRGGARKMTAAFMSISVSSVQLTGLVRLLRWLAF